MVYVYQCSCGNVFEQINTCENRHNAKCTKCNSINVQKLLSSCVKLLVQGYLKDVNGEFIWFPKDGRPYFDKALRRTFNSAKEKQKYMKDKEIVMKGDEGVINWPVEAGDMRSKSYRRAMRWED